MTEPKPEPLGVLGRLFCRLGWHKVTCYTGFDGISAKATCARCGYKGLIDSQGNLF